MNFKDFFTNYLLLEDKQISSIITNEDFQNLLYKYGLNNKFRNFLSLTHLQDIDFKIGKQGTLVIRDYTAPVKIIDIKEDNNQKYLILEKTDGSDFEDMTYLFPPFVDRTKKQIILYNKYFYSIIPNKIFSIISKWLVFLDQRDELEEFLSNYSLQLLALDNYDFLKTTNATLQNINKQLENKKQSQEIQKGKSNFSGPEGRTVLSFPDGWKWVSLDKGYCKNEGKAAGHCGNSSPRSTENIISLRDNNNRIHITLVVDENNKTTNEFKGVGNRKPKSYTHKYIVELLSKTDIISEIGKGKYLPENDFKLEDLNLENIDKLKKSGFLPQNWKIGQSRNELDLNVEWIQILKNKPDKFKKYYEEQTDLPLPLFERYLEDDHSFVVKSGYDTINRYLNYSSKSKILNKIYNIEYNNNFQFINDNIDNKSFKKWLKELSIKNNNKNPMEIFLQTIINIHRKNVLSDKNMLINTFLSNIYYEILNIKNITLSYIPKEFKLSIEISGRATNNKNLDWKLLYYPDSNYIDSLEEMDKINDKILNRIQNSINDISSGELQFQYIIDELPDYKLIQIIDDVITRFPFYKKI